MIRALAIALLLTTTASAQQWHQLPPVGNIVGAGFNIEYAAKVKETATWVRLAGGLATGILIASEDTRNTSAPWVAGAMTLGLSLTLDLHGARWSNRAGDLLQCGYSPNYLYETIPDSLGMDPPKRFNIPRMIDGNKIHIPARMRFR